MRVATIALVMLAAFAGLRAVAPAADIRGTLPQAPAVNAAFVNAAFQVLFNRSASPSDVAYWANPGTASQGKAAVVQAMMNTTEFRQAEISALFQHFLGRAASSADIAQVGGGGSTMVQIATEIIASPEYYGKAGGTIAGFLAKVYSDALGTPITPQGIAYFNGLFTSSQGLSSTTVATSVEQGSAGSAYLTAWLAQNVLHPNTASSGGTLVSDALAAIAQLLG